jgi:hypothetical protein
MALTVADTADFPGFSAITGTDLAAVLEVAKVKVDGDGESNGTAFATKLLRKFGISV